MSQGFDANINRPCRFYILAHPDDEIMALPFLLEKTFQNFVVYLTDGAGIQGKNDQKEIRFNELIRAVHLLNSIDVSITLYHLTSQSVDSKCHKSLRSDHLLQLQTMLVTLRPREIVTLSFEGGHQDHDSANFVARILAMKLQIPLRCFATYRAGHSRLVPLRVMTPTHTSAQLKFPKIRVSVIALRLMLIYRSQWKTWIGLGPIVFMKYLLRPWRREDIELDLRLTPIKNCYYEIRGRSDQADVLASLKRLKSDFLFFPLNQGQE